MGTVYLKVTRDLRAVDVHGPMITGQKIVWRGSRKIKWQIRDLFNWYRASKWKSYLFWLFWHGLIWTKVRRKWNESKNHGIYWEFVWSSLIFIFIIIHARSYITISGKFYYFRRPYVQTGLRTGCQKVFFILIKPLKVDYKCIETVEDRWSTADCHSRFCKSK